MNLQLFPTNIVYNSFDNLSKARNTYAIVEKFAFAIKYSKKLKKNFLRKVWLKCDKNRSYKVKKHRVQQMSIMKNKYLCKVITTYHSK